MAAMFGFCKSDPHMPIEHLDYNYIETCEDMKKLQKIIRILRSGEEGRYPDLEEFAERQLAKKMPDCALLEKSNTETMSRDLAKDERMDIVEDLQEFASSTKPHVLTNGVHDLPPIRNTTMIDTNVTKDSKPTKKIYPNKKVVPRSYDEWAKLDKQIEKKDLLADDEKAKSTEVKDIKPAAYELLGNVKSHANKPSEERAIAAQNEKKKGNEAFQCGDYNEALVYYNRSLDIEYNCTVLNNRAITYIKLEKYLDALSDSNNVIQQQPDNIKSHLRRGICHQALKMLPKALEDFSKVLELEPTNKRGKELCQNVRKEIEKQQPKSKGKRLIVEDIDSDQIISEEKNTENINNNKQSDNKNNTMKGRKLIIEDVNSSQGNEEKTLTVDNKDVISENIMNSKEEIVVNDKHVQSVLVKELPTEASTLISEANSLYKTGTYPEACERYTSAIHLLLEEPSGFENALATLFSSRAICQMKMGHCSKCIHDCNKSIQFAPTAKAYLRRASAYETLEKFIDAYVDYQSSLQYDNSLVTAQQGCSRIGGMLKSEHGKDWREKLPIRSLPRIPSGLFTNNLSVIDNKNVGIESTVGKTQTEAMSSSKLTSTTKTERETIEKKTQPGQMSAVEQFKEIKENGNKCVQKGNYSEAIGHYTLCIKLLPDEVPSYTNRALCYLKLKKVNEAIEDCSKALGRQPENVKALFRKAQARKMLKQYKEALSDLAAVLKLEPNNTAAKKETEECKDLFRAALRDIQAKSQSVKQKSNDEKIGKKISIEEVLSEANNSTKKTKMTTKTQTCPTAKSNQQKAPQLKKMTGFEFLQAWNSIKSGKSSDYAELLKQVEPHKLPELLSNKLDGDILKNLVHAVHDHITSKEAYKQGVLLLKHLSRTSRFVVMLMFLSTADKTLLKSTMDLLETRMKQNGDKSADISNLRSSYQCS